jgi:hypothetical protein
MHRRLLRALVALAGVILATAMAAAAARSERSPARTIARYCSQSGDVCYGIFNRGGQVILQITTAAHYFSRYTLCLTRLPRSKNPGMRGAAAPSLSSARAGRLGARP